MLFLTVVVILDFMDLKQNEYLQEQCTKTNHHWIRFTPLILLLVITKYQRGKKEIVDYTLLSHYGTQMTLIFMIFSDSYQRRSARSA